MLIEADARLFITEAIEVDKEIFAIEQKEKARGRIVVDTVETGEKCIQFLKDMTLGRASFICLDRVR